MSTPPGKQKKHPATQRTGFPGKTNHWKCFTPTTAGHLELARKKTTIPNGSKPAMQSSKSLPSTWNGSTPKKSTLTQVGKTGRLPNCSRRLPILAEENRGATHSQTPTSV